MQPDFSPRRQQMVDTQIVARRVREPGVVAAFRRVPRHEFVDPKHEARAYGDHPISIGKGQTISQPYMVALMTQELKPTPASRVLEIGTGSGYQTAILAELASEVYTVERVQTLSKGAEDTIARLGYSNVHFRVGDGTLGWPEHAPFDRIIVTAGGPRVPPSLVDQLTIGGILVIPVGDTFHQTLTVVTRADAGVQERSVCGCVFVKLVGEEGWD